MLAAFGADMEAATVQGFFESVEDPDAQRVRVGRRGDWAYALEQFTAVGTDDHVLRGLSDNGREAFNLTYTQTIDTFSYARDGVLVNRFDLTVTHLRYGSDPHCFDGAMADVGFLEDEPAGPAAGALFINLLFGLELDQDMLEGPSLSAKIAT
jgi:hypothetical protein